jgi:hypothetical protein
MYTREKSSIHERSRTMDEREYEIDMYCNSRAKSVFSSAFDDVEENGNEHSSKLG